MAQGHTAQGRGSKRRGRLAERLREELRRQLLYQASAPRPGGAGALAAAILAEAGSDDEVRAAAGPPPWPSARRSRRGLLALAGALAAAAIAVVVVLALGGTSKSQPAYGAELVPSREGDGHLRAVAPERTGASGREPDPAIEGSPRGVQPRRRSFRKAEISRRSGPAAASRRSRGGAAKGVWAPGAPR